MTKEIEFIYLDEYSFNVCEKVFPSKKIIPEWLKKIKPYEKSIENTNGNKIIVENHESNASAKKCIPMRDAITSGYTVPLWTDVAIRQVNNFPRITWRTSHDVFELHGSSSRDIPPPFGYDPIVFKYISNLKIKTPKGYSILVLPVIGHNRQPFTAIPAIIDSDKSCIDNSFPVWIQSEFEGIVEKGTPMVQIIPFKRDNWKSRLSWITREQHVMEQDKGMKSTIVNNYIKNIWSRKEFN